MRNCDAAANKTVDLFSSDWRKKLTVDRVGRDEVREEGEEKGGEEGRKGKEEDGGDGNHHPASSTGI